MNETEFDASRVDSYDYDLPRELIAQHPLDHRIDARLLLINRSSGELSHHYVRDLPDLLNAGDVLVLNNSKVIPARLVGLEPARVGRWEGLYLRSAENGFWEITQAKRAVI